MAAAVLHLLDAMGSTRLWGKERAVEALMHAQRRAGLEPRLATFAPSPLVDVMRAAGFTADVLDATSRRLAFKAVGRLVALLRAHPATVLHTHGYKANVVGRLARLAGARPRRLIATVHGMNDETWTIAQYNRLDRMTAPVSDVVTLADASLAPSFPRRARVLFVENGVEDRPLCTQEERARARERFAFAPDAFVVGLLGRVTEAKGVADALDALAALHGSGVVFAFAGEGPLADRVRATPHARCVGYVEDGEAYLAACDAYLQASHWEGLSLALLEAMRAGLPCVATRVGSTDRAIEDGVDGLLVPQRRPDAIAAAIARLIQEPSLCRRLGLAARAQFSARFSIERQAARYAALYDEA